MKKIFNKILFSSFAVLFFTLNLSATTYAVDPATQDSPILSTELGGSSTNEDLTATAQNVVDPVGNPTKVIYNWLLNSAPISVLNLPFEGNGTESTYTKDYSGKNNNGTVTNAIWSATGGVDNKGVYQFTGSENIIVPNNSDINFTGNFTIETWINMDGAPTSANSNIFNKMFYTTKGFQINVPTNLKPSFVLADGSTYKYINSNIAITYNNWHHIVSIYKDGFLYIYIDGVQAGAPVASNPPVPATTLDLFIGRAQLNATGYGFNGKIDEVNFYNRALSATQIANLAAGNRNILSSAETANNDNWSIETTINNGYVDSLVKTSNVINLIDLPDPATSLSPTNTVDGSTLTSSPTTFNFNINNQLNADIAYQMQFDNNSDFSSPELDYTSSTIVNPAGAQVTYTLGQVGTYAAGSNLTVLIDGPQYWRVKYYHDPAGINTSSAWTTANSGSIAFIQSTDTPYVPTVASSSTTDGSTINDNTPELNFNLSAYNTGLDLRYRIQIASSSDFLSPVIDYTSDKQIQGLRGFTVGQTLSGGGDPLELYTEGSAGQTLLNGAYYVRIKTINNPESPWLDINNGDSSFTISTSPTVVPEFSTYMLMLILLTGMGMIYWKREEIISMR